MPLFGSRPLIYVGATSNVIAPSSSHSSPRTKNIAADLTDPCCAVNLFLAVFPEFHIFDCVSTREEQIKRRAKNIFGFIFLLIFKFIPL